MTVLVIDIGSSSVRALLLDDQAQPIPGAHAVRPHELATSPPGAAVANPEGLRLRAESCIDEVLKHPAAAEVKVVALATLVGNVLGVDGDGRPVTPLYTYADTRSAEDVALLKQRINLDEVHQRTGCIHHTAYLPGRLHWLRRTETRLFESVVFWIDIGTYLYRRWFGQAACSYSVASWSGLLNRATLEWDQEWLDLLNLDVSCLPPLADYSDLHTSMTPDYMRRWYALREVPFCLAVGDGVAANVGSGCVDSSAIALTVGTTAALRLISDDQLPPVPAGLWSYRVDKSLHLIGGATSEGGNIFAWAQETLALGDADELEQHLARCTPDGHGLTFLPLLAGERSPGWTTDATGAIIGLRLSTTPLDMVQAALEGVALRLSLIFEQLAPLAAADVVVVGGGGALVSSPAWGQIIATALGRPLHLTAVEEITARGAAILALRAIGASSLLDHPPPIEMTLHPQPGDVEVMRAARERQQDLYRKFVQDASA